MILERFIKFLLSVKYLFFISDKNDGNIPLHLETVETEYLFLLKHVRS